MGRHVRFRLSAGGKSYLERQAEAEGVSFSDLLRGAILERIPIARTDPLIMDMCETIGELLGKLLRIFADIGSQSPAYSGQAERGTRIALSARGELDALARTLRSKPEPDAAAAPELIAVPTEDPPRTEMISLRLTDAQFEKLSEEADEADLPLSDFARGLLSSVFVSRKIDAAVLDAVLAIRDAVSEFGQAVWRLRPPADSFDRERAAELESLLQDAATVPEALARLTESIKNIAGAK